MSDEIKKEAEEILTSLQRVRNILVSEQENLQIRLINMKRLYQEDIETINKIMTKNLKDIEEVDQTIAETKELIK